ncbi:unnamed protein product [Colias eurytheme]|nr:unnamed protein product [Colias eurytheme]
MSSEYYFKQWQKTLHKLEQILYLDIEYQETKSHDKSWCDAALKLSGMLGCYIACYNEALECSQQNLQVQKSEDIHAIVKAIVERILELKEQLRKHEGSYYQFIGGGLIKHKLTPYDAELHDIEEKYERPENIQLIINEAFQKAREIKEEDLNEFDETVIDENNGDWWNETDVIEESDKKHGINIGAIYEVEEIISEETLHRKHLIALIQAHEKSRQLIQKLTWQKHKRYLWEKELKGTLNPSARLQIREKAAIIIQKVLRIYFQIKRKRIRDDRYDELIGIKIRKKSDENEIKIDKQRMIFDRSQKYKELNAQWLVECEEIKNKFLKRKRDDIADDFREYIREWFKKWFDEAKFFLDIPKENQGGLSIILKEEVSSPSEWIEEYKAYMENKKANKNKTATERKWEKMEAKREEFMLKREEIRKKKKEAELLKKIMKNPKMHPGYHYPKSKKIQRLVKAVEEYKKKWLHLDERNCKEIKEGYIKDIDINNLYAEAKHEILNTIEEDMREELKKLKQALKDDYARNEEQMPENIKQKVKRSKKKHKVKAVNEEIILEKLINLVSKGILVEYPETRFEDFLAEYKFAGDDLKCDLRVVQPLGGEMLSIWWEKCREVTHGFKRILLVGPRNSGKTTLIHVMASINNATLYDLNLLELNEEPVETVKEIIAALISCAKTTQPSIIYIRHVHRLYYRKPQSNDVSLNAAMLKKCIIKRLIKKIHALDKITLIGSCMDPWLTNSKLILKHFSSVVMIPPTNYTTTHLVLQQWMIKNRIIPTTLDTQSLAHMLQGYSVGYLKNYLEHFLSPERIIRIAAYGLKANEIYEHFIQNETEPKIDYEKYRIWYDEKTQWGKIEKKHLEEQIEFQNLVNKWREKEEKKKKKHG